MKKSATDTIKKLSPKNVSGTIPQALDLIQELKKVKGNPKMVDAVGQQNLMKMLQFLSNIFNNNSSNNVNSKSILDLLDLNLLSQLTGLPVAQIETIVKEILGLIPGKLSFEITSSQINIIANAILSLPNIDQLLRNKINIFVEEAERIQSIGNP